MLLLLLFSHSVTSNSATPWTVACQAPLSMRFPKQEYCTGLPFPPPGDLPNPGIDPTSPTLQAGSLPTEPPGKLPGQLASDNTPAGYALGNQFPTTEGLVKKNPGY